MVYLFYELFFISLFFYFFMNTKEEIMKKITILTASQGKNAELGKKIKEVAEKKFNCELVDLVELNLPLK